MKAYDKPALDHQAQVDILKSRGLEVPDVSAASLFLSQVGYYRFTTYCFAFQSDRDHFLPGSRFEAIERLYRSDEDLRGSIFSALSVLEVYLRARFVDALTLEWGPFAHYSRELSRSDFRHEDWIATVEKEIQRAREPFIERYKAKYSGFPRLPLWMAVETMSLGTLSTLFNGLLPEPRRKIAEGLGQPHPVLRSWLHFINYLRNVCAHHARLWDRELAIRPDIPRKDQEWQALSLDGTKVFCAVPVLEAMYRWAGLSEEQLTPMRTALLDFGSIDSRFFRFSGVPEGWDGSGVLSDRNHPSWLGQGSPDAPEGDEK